MSQNNPHQITESDKEQLAEHLKQSREHGNRIVTGRDGLDDGTAVQQALAGLPENTLASTAIVCAYLFETGSHTAHEITDAVPVSKPAVYNAVNALVSLGLVNEQTKQTPEVGRNPTVYSPQPWAAIDEPGGDAV